jgi:L-glutamine-phosphate cytidylyltransferase
MKDQFKAIILAAGQGTRLRPFTDTVPKCMVEAAGRPLLEWHLDTLEAVGIREITLVAGYKQEKITDTRVSKIVNERYATTNMIESLFTAESVLNGNVIIAYGDIVYSKEVLSQLMSDHRDIVVACDDGWESYWSDRFEDPLSDAETFVKGPDGRVASLGKKTTNISQVQGQYIGLIKLNNAGCARLKALYHEAKNDPEQQKNAWDSGRTLELAYMTDLLNYLASMGELYYSSINRGWVEVDDHVDLEIAKNQLPW